MLPAFRDVTMLILKVSRGTMKLKLWDENAERLVRFKDIGRCKPLFRMMLAVSWFTIANYIGVFSAVTHRHTLNVGTR